MVTRVTIKKWLDELPAAYEQPLGEPKVNQVYEHIYYSYEGTAC